MSHEPEVGGDAVEDQGGLLTLALLSLITGTATGLLVGVFRLILERADRLRDALVVPAWLGNEPIYESLRDRTLRG